MSVLAAIRPDNINIALFVHVLGAMLLVGTLFAVALAIGLGWRNERLIRFALRLVPFAVVPAYIVMRIGAQWTESREHLGDANFTWLDIGYLTSDIGAVVILVALVVAILGLRRLRTGSGRTFGRVAGVLAGILVAAYVVAVWAMTTKPD
jgi:hypothetical protein